MSRDRITIATDMARERLEEAGLGICVLNAPDELLDGSVRFAAVLTVSADDIDAQIDLLRERGVERDSAPATSAPGTDAHGRLTDVRIAEHLADARIGVADRGHGAELSQDELVSVLFELQQHRARIAAHAAAHPERLSDGDVSEIIASVGDDGDTSHLEDTLDGDEILSLAVECWQRRAADLTEPQIDQVRAMLRDAVADRPIVCGPERIEILSDIIRAHGARP